MSRDLEAVFVPADPPRAGQLALWSSSQRSTDAADSTVELVLPAGSRVRRSILPARLLPVGEALSVLTSPPDPQATDSHRAWAAAAVAGLGVVARGKLVPARSDGGLGAWRAGPLDAGEYAWLRQLAAAMPVVAHAIPRPGGPGPLRIASPESLVRAFWDAIADTLARGDDATPGAEAFARPEPVPLEGSTAWLDEADLGAHQGARLVLRIEPPSAGHDDAPAETGESGRTPAAAAAESPERSESTERSGSTGPPERSEGRFRGVFQLRSSTDPSLLVSVADLWSAPAAVLARLGSRAETDLLLALRRGTRAWPPFGASLGAATPTGIDLADADLDDLVRPAPRHSTGRASRCCGRPSCSGPGSR